MFLPDTPVILDGPAGTQLQARGMPRGVCPELWAAERPDVLRDIQKSYVSAGAMALLAPTFGANEVKLDFFGLAGRMAELNEELIRQTRANAGQDVWVGGGLSPLGLFVPPYGDTPFETMVGYYRRQAEAINREGVDFFHVETQMSVFEARAAVIGIREVSLRPIFVSFVCDSNGKTLSGADIEAALVTMQAMGVNAFGLNCVTGDCRSLFKRLSNYAAIPLLYKPNAGLPDGNGNYNVGPEEMAEPVVELASYDVRLFGSCCGGTAAHIAALSDALDGLLPASPLEAPPEGIAADSRRIYETSEPDGDFFYLDGAQALERLAEDQFYAAGPAVLAADNSEWIEKALRAYHGIPRVRCGL